MAGSVNKVILVGHVGADPEIRRTQNGHAMATFRLATSESWRDKTSGERREKTEWYSIVVLNEAIAKVVEQYIKKGAKLYLEGALQTRKWQDKDGNDRYSTEVLLQGFGATLTMLDSQGSGYRSGGNGASDYGHDPERAAGRSTSSSASSSAPSGMGGAMDDDIPF